MASSGVGLASAGGKNRRGRPSASQAAEIDEKVRAAALEQFLSAGYDAASMDAIAVAARVSKGTLYARYKNKEALFRSILESELEKLSDRASAEDHLLPGDLAPRLRQHARKLIESLHIGEFDHVQKLMASAQHSLPELATLWNEIAVQRYVRFLADDMAAHANLTGDVEVDWMLLANMFLHSIGGWQHAERLARDVSDEEVIAFGDAVIDIILKAIPQRG